MTTLAEFLISAGYDGELFLRHIVCDQQWRIDDVMKESATLEDVIAGYWSHRCPPHRDWKSL